MGLVLQSPWPRVVTPPAAGVFVYDTMAGANNVDPASRLPDVGGAWTQTGSNLMLLNGLGQLKGNANGGAGLRNATTSPTGDVTLEADIVVNSAGDLCYESMGIRIQGSNSYSYYYDSGTPGFHVSGPEGALGTYGIQMAAGSHHLTFSAIGTTIKIDVDGGNQSWTSISLSGAGLISFGSTFGGLWDNVKATAS